jgi:hypothetical protein
MTLLLHIFGLPEFRNGYIGWKQRLLKVKNAEYAVLLDSATAKFGVDFCLKFGIIPASLPTGKRISPQSGKVSGQVYRGIFTMTGRPSQNQLTN